MVMFRDLVIGQKYHVEMTDCCIAMEFTATLLRADLEDSWDGETLWDNGVLLRGSGTDFEAVPCPIP